ncbi:hypothetical protein ACTXT7_016238, partial [Hymenolepis weldensis]
AKMVRRGELLQFNIYTRAVGGQIICLKADWARVTLIDPVSMDVGEKVTINRCR